LAEAQKKACHFLGDLLNKGFLNRYLGAKFLLLDFVIFICVMFP